MKYFIFCFLACVAVRLQAQITITGTIKDAATHQPLPGAAIYIPELHVGTISDSTGNYTLTDIGEAKFLIQFSLLGYTTQFISFDPASVHIININLVSATIEMQEVRIIGTQILDPKETSRSVAEISADEMREKGALSISDGVAKVPGVSQLTTGPGISKPVIRGLYGNRIQVNTLGLRFDNQQWQDEHGLGLTDIGIDRVEIIRGPATLQYGSEALGGVINIVEEKPAPVGEKEQEVNLSLFSNTYGISGDYGIKKSDLRHWWILRAGGDSHGDYTDGNNHRVLNARFADYVVKAAMGSNKNNWSHTWHAMGSVSQFGFVFDSISRIEEDARLSRSMDGPHHQVFFGILSTENTRYDKSGQLKINAGIHSNLRQEQEGGNRISLNMLLNTFSGIAQYTRYLPKNAEFSYGTDILFQTNSNFGSRTIVPDAIIGEGALFGYYKIPFRKLIFEAGLRYDRRQIKAFETSTINGPGSEIQPFSKGFNGYNGSVGTSLLLTDALNIKFNIASGFRSGNLAELSSNGLHEGTVRWEIGDPDLKPEQNVNGEISLNYDQRHFSCSITGYYDHFLNYIYLAPTGLEYVGFHIYQFMQTNADLKGSEISADIHPAGISWLDLHASYSYIDAEKMNPEDSNKYLPFIPANTLRGEWRTELKKRGNFVIGYFSVGCDYVFAQDYPAEFETPTPAYFLLNAGAGGYFHIHQQEIKFSLYGKNLLNELYFDHLSRFKDYGIYNQGRDISLSVTIPF